jgi:hypothetical protein
MQDGGNGGTAPLTLNLGTRCLKRPRYLLNGRMEDSTDVTDVSVKVRTYKNEGKDVRGQLQAQILHSGNYPPIRVEQKAWVAARSHAGPFGENYAPHAQNRQPIASYTD